jgi:hypothetical protein
VTAHGTIDVLMVTHNRPYYTRLALERLLATSDDDMRVWLWHNGEHEETLELVKSFLEHPNVYRFHHSVENKKLRDPMNWLWTESDGSYLSKVDDDCLVPFEWTRTLRQAHEDVPEFGVLGCWRFRDEDFIPELAQEKMREFAGHRILQNNWIEGSGFLLKREGVDTLGTLRPEETFTQYCGRLAAAGFVHGWYVPFLYQEHMDDPRSAYCLLKTDDDLRREMPLMAQTFALTTLDDRIKQIQASARSCQSSSIHPRAHVGWRKLSRRMRRRAIAKLRG